DQRRADTEGQAQGLRGGRGAGPLRAPGVPHPLGGDVPEEHPPDHERGQDHRADPEDDVEHRAYSPPARAAGTRTIPSWATVLTSCPSRVYIRPRDRPRAPDADGLSSTYR